jgi:hypothetical protein
MSLKQRTRRRRRLQTTWVLIAISALIAVALGVVGYSEYYEASSGNEAPPGVFALLKDSVRLLLVESSAGEDFPSALRLARFFAFLSWSAAAIKGFLTFARKRIELARCRRQRDHAVVCGLGRLGAQLVSDLRAQQIKTIVVELDADNPEVAAVRAEGIPVLVGNATSATKLRDASAQRARYIFAVTGNDRINIEVASKAFEVRDEYDGDDFVQLCAVHVDDAEISTLFSERPLFKDRTERFDAHFFNINRLAARVLIDRCPPDRVQSVHGPDDPAASIMVFGSDALAQQIVTQIARVGHYGNKKKPIVRLVPGDERDFSRFIEKRIPALREFLDLRIDDATDLESLLRDDDLLEKVVSEHPPSVVYICLKDAVSSLRLVAGLLRIDVTEEARIVVCAEERSDYMLLGPSPGEEGGPQFALFDVMRDVCTIENVMREKLDDLAKAIHQDYVVRQKELGYSVDTNSTLVDWYALPPGLREANRHQADYIPVKLRVLGYDPPKSVPSEDLKLTPKQLDLVAELEHRRWMAAKRLAGWRYTAGQKDAAKRVAPTIIGWEALTEEEKEKDRDTARDLPRLLQMKLAIDSEQT